MINLSHLEERSRLGIELTDQLLGTVAGVDAAGLEESLLDGHLGEVEDDLDVVVEQRALTAAAAGESGNDDN